MNNKLLILIVLFLFTSCTQPKIESKYANIDFDNLEIKDFVAYVSKEIGKEIKMIDEIKGKVNLLSNQPLLKSDLIPLLNDVVGNKEMVLISHGTYYSIIKISTEGLSICGIPSKELGKR